MGSVPQRGTGLVEGAEFFLEGVLLGLNSERVRPSRRKLDGGFAKFFKGGKPMGFDGALRLPRHFCFAKDSSQ